MALKDPLQSLEVNKRFKLDKFIRVNRYGNLSIGFPELYYLYKHCGLKKPPVSKKLYVAVLKFVFLKIWEQIIKNIWRFKMPFKLGSYYIVDKVGATPKHKDWISTREKGELVRRYNIHTKGHRFRFKWNKGIGGPRHLFFYNLNPCRFTKGNEIAGRRGLARWIKKCAADPLMKDFKAHLD